MSEYGWGIVVGVVATIVVSAVANGIRWWWVRRAVRGLQARIDAQLGMRGIVPGRLFDFDKVIKDAAAASAVQDALIDGAPEPPLPVSGLDGVPDDPTDWLHVWAYVDGFAAFVKTFRDLSTARPAEPRPVLANTVNVYQYVAERPPYVGHPQVEEWMEWFDEQIVQGFEYDLTYTLDDVAVDLADCRAKLKDLLERVGPPRKRSVAARLQGQINRLLDAAAKDRADRRSVSEIKSTFGVGSFGGDPRPGSGPMG